MGKKCEKINGDLTIILAYMNGDLRYTCGGKLDLCMDKPVFKRKIYDEIYEWKESRSDKYALLIKGARRPLPMLPTPIIPSLTCSIYLFLLLIFTIIKD